MTNLQNSEKVIAFGGEDGSDKGLPAGFPEEAPDDWKCPRCKLGKEKFNKA